MAPKVQVLHALVAEADAFPKTLKDVGAKERELRAALRQVTHVSDKRHSFVCFRKPASP